MAAAVAAARPWSNRNGGVGCGPPLDVASRDHAGEDPRVKPEGKVQGGPVAAGTAAGRALGNQASAMSRAPRSMISLTSRT